MRRKRFGSDRACRSLFLHSGARTLREAREREQLSSSLARSVGGRFANRFPGVEARRMAYFCNNSAESVCTMRMQHMLACASAVFYGFFMEMTRPPAVGSGGGALRARAAAHK